MKTKTFYQILSLLIFAMLFIQCSKSDEPKTNDQNLTQLSALDQKINSMVTNFKSKLVAKEKSGEIMSTDSALWYICTTLNATYANCWHNDQTPGKTYVDSLTITLPENDGNLTIEQIENLYNKILDSTRFIYHQIEDNDKQLATLIFEPLNSSSQLNVKMLTYSTWGLQYWEQFAPTESYFWGLSDDIGNPVNPNAPLKLMDKFQRHVSGPSAIVPYPGYYWVFSEQHSIIEYLPYPFNYNPSVYPPYSNYLDFYLFTNFTAYPGFHETMCADELNFYLSKIIWFADVKVPQLYNIPISTTHKCYQVNVGCNMAWCGQAWVPGNLTTISHSVSFYYGDRIKLPFPQDAF